MSDPKHERLRAVFDRALDLPAEDREDMVRAECADDPTLAKRVLTMLATMEDDSFLATPVGGVLGGGLLGDEGDASPLQEGPGSRIGPYKLLEKIGEGGFGAVFMAEQERPVARRVALKIIKLGMDTRQVVARFEQERQALALMEHPNIARVFDAGATEAGRPYFVMELVKGEPIGAYCDRERLSVTERLELFGQVCNAVQHAHGKGIIHRDLKPSNILVATHDGRPSAKVIDFGIAKATTDKLTEKTLFTEHHQVVGTLQYMSPEQAQGSLDIDTRTDIYALGVVLYELLTGSPPLDKETLADKLYEEIQRLIKEVEPPRPSTRLSGSGERLATLAAQRKIAPARLGMLLRHDLDWVVMKALEKDRGRRYQTVGGLADDVHRYLGGQPVQAAPPSKLYQLQKFVRRNRVGVGASALVAAALLAGFAGTLWGLVEARKGREEAVRQARIAEEEGREAERQAKVADAERAKAEEQRALTEDAREQLERVVTFQATMLRRVPPYDMGVALAEDLSERVREAQVGLGLDEARVAEELLRFETFLGGISMTDAARNIIDVNVLQPAAAEVAVRFAGEPVAQARLYATIADTYGDLGLFDKSLEILEAELALQVEHEGLMSPATLSTRGDIVHTLFKLGRLDETRETLEEVYPLMQRVLPADDRVRLGVRQSQAVLWMGDSRNEEALAEFREILAVQERTLGFEHEDLSLTLSNIGTALLNLERGAEAVEPLARGLAIRRKARGSEAASTLALQQRLAAAYESQRRFDEAYAMRSEAVETLGRIHGAHHPHTIDAVAQLAENLKSQSRYAEAEVQARRALELRRRVRGDLHPKTIDSMSDVGILCSMLGRHTEAEPFFVEALKAAEELKGPDSSLAADKANNLAVCYWYQGKYAEVEPLFVRAFELNRKKFGDEHPETAFCMLNLAILYHKLGRLDDERPLLEGALAVYEERFGSDNENTVRAKVSLAVLYFDTDEDDEAEALLLDLVEDAPRVLGRNNTTTIECIANLAALYVKQGRDDEAEPLLVQALDLRRETLGRTNQETLRVLNDLVLVYLRTDREDEARPLLEELVQARRAAASAPDATPKALENGAVILIDAPLEDLRDPALALEFATRANDRTGGVLPDTLHVLARTLHANGRTEDAVETLERALELLPPAAPARRKYEQRLTEFRDSAGR